MTRCTPHYPARRWQRCRVELALSVEVRTLWFDQGTLHWVPVIVKPYRTGPGRGRGGIFFPRCYRRGLPDHRGWRW